MLYLNSLKSKRNILSVCLLFFSLASVFAQQNSVSGIVTDENEEPLAGVTVLLKGTTNATSSDANGKYRLTVDKNFSNSDVF